MYKNLFILIIVLTNDDIMGLLYRKKYKKMQGGGVTFSAVPMNYDASKDFYLKLEKNNYQFKNKYEAFSVAIFFIWLVLCSLFVATFGNMQITGRIIFLLILILLLPLFFTYLWEISVL